VPFFFSQCDSLNGFLSIKSHRTPKWQMVAI